ncbi:MAG: putative glycoside hydrolase [Bacilli bacterium]
MARRRRTKFKNKGLMFLFFIGAVVGWLLMARRRRTKFKNKGLMFLFFIGAVVVGYIAFNLLSGIFNIVVNNKSEMYLASSTHSVDLYDAEFKQSISVPRGGKVLIDKANITIGENNNKYYEVIINGENYYIKVDSLANDEKGVVMEKYVYVRTPVNLMDPNQEGKLLILVNKGDQLEVIGFNKVDASGKVDVYRVRVNNIEGLINANYVVLDKESALAHYEPDKYYNVHYQRGNRYGGGHAGNLDYYPVEKPTFEENKMPDPVYALYLNNGTNVIPYIDKYIDLVKDTKINAFVVDIKENEAPGYKSEVMKKYSPTNYKYANNSYETYKEAIKKLKDAGFYVIGRITTFQDKYYALDHPEHSITYESTGELYPPGWPSPYQRAVWEFNVELAKEAVKEFGFNEIQFDYVRFPDKVSNKGLDFKNIYNEEKAQAIQRFTRYATDELHKLGVYVSIDVFGESAHNYVTAYGQYWAAISNIVDVISGMPYPDHFNAHEYGFEEIVWTVPYDLLKYWGSTYVMKRQSEIPTPAKLRTWVQGYNTIRAPYISYDAPEVEAQIRGLFDAGLTDGYMVWNAGSSINKYRSQLNAYKKDYK